MLVWLLVLFLLFAFAYVVYRVVFLSDEVEEHKDHKHNYTFKI